MFTYEGLLRELSEFDGRGTNVLSVYLPTDPLTRTRADVEAKFLRMADALRGELEPGEQRALETDVAEVIDYLRSMISPPTTVAIFVCSRREFFRIVRLPVMIDAGVFWAPRPNLAQLGRAGYVMRLHALPL